MRLSKIKLSGFKSFADPTALEFPEGIAAVTGPNGAGKSNLIDAVRWVMGESSAKILRGESMPDVIFGGSNTRKPASQASVELVFDNSDGRVGGDYAAYNEIAIRRVVGRDGISQYYLNGSLCRRRDITDIFLGTGLGPRSYAIIEQGTISRLVDLKPEEWQLFLEEAAGVSKYKERRRETLARVENTRERLESVNQIREELAKRLHQLAQQARQAERFQALRETERLTRSRLCVLEKQGFVAALEERMRTIREGEAEIEGVRAQQTRVDLLLLELAERRRQAASADQEAQRQVFEAEKRLDQLQSAHEQRLAERERLRGEMERITGEQARIETHLADDEGTLERDQAERQTLTETLAAAREALARLQTELERREGQTRDLDDRLDALRERLAQARQRIELLALEQKHVQDQSLVLRERAAELAHKLSASTFSALRAERDRASLAHEQLLTECSRYETELGERKQKVAEDLAALRQAEMESNRIAVEREQARARLQSHEQMRAQALALEGEEARQWLERNGLHDHPRLADLLDVAPEAEPLVRAVLGHRLKAVGVERLESTAASCAALATSTIVLFEMQPPGQAGRPPENFPQLGVRRVDLADFFASVERASSLDDALARRAELAYGRCFVTPEGVLVGSHWMAVDRGDPALGSVFVHDREIRSLQETLDRLEQDGMHAQGLLEARRTALDTSTGALGDLEQHLARAREALLRSGAICAELEARLTESERQRLDWAAAQGGIEKELTELAHRIQTLESSVRAAEAERATLEAEQRQLTGEFEALDEERDQMAAQLKEAAERERDQNLELEKQRLAYESARQRIQEWRRHLETLATQAATVAAKEAEMDGSDSDRADLEAALTARTQAEAQLAQVRDTLRAIESEVEARERERSESARQVEELRAHLEQKKLTAQDLKTRLHELEARAERLHCDWNVSLEPGVSQADCELELGKIEQKLERLGQVNLMATQDYATELGRKEALDRQFEDITSALASLEEAMRKIDRESQARFHETFNQVNQGLKQLFPRLFGGGYAELRLVENESGATSGVSLYARPPGKRPASISQLSGGEKALAAIAIVFAIFNLNPAPFCMLDEVDAPMDENSIVRFTELVRELSTRVQLILISHNRLSLEAADHLVGVTMQEPGVSRLVAVSIEEATRLAATG